jgi:hypothetical protein
MEVAGHKIPTVTSRTTKPSGIAALPGTMLEKGDVLLVSMSVISSFIFFKVLVKRH